MEERQTLKAITVLLRASQSIQDVVKHEVAEYGLNPTEFSVLELLYHKGDQPIQTIGKKVLLTSGSMTYIVRPARSERLLDAQSLSKRPARHVCGADGIRARAHVVHLSDP